MKNNKKSKTKNKKLNEKLKSEYDPLGSYTGVCERGETPIQDADDL